MYTIHNSQQCTKLDQKSFKYTICACTHSHSPVLLFVWDFCAGILPSVTFQIPPIQCQGIWKWNSWKRHDSTIVHKCNVWQDLCPNISGIDNGHKALFWVSMKCSQKLIKNAKSCTFMKSTPSTPAISLGNFFSMGSMVPGSGMLRPQKNSLDLKICICRGIKSPKFLRMR